MLNFDLTEEQRLLEQSVREWAGREIAPRIRELDRAHKFDRGIQIITAALVGILHGMRGITNREAAIVASAIAHVGLKDVIVNRVARAQHTIRKNVRMRVTPFA